MVQNGGGANMPFDLAVVYLTPTHTLTRTLHTLWGWIDKIIYFLTGSYNLLR